MTGDSKQGAALCENKCESAKLQDEKLENKFKSPHLRYLLMLSPAFLCFSMMVFSFVFINITPSFECKQEEDIYACSIENREVFGTLCNSSTYNHCVRYFIPSFADLKELNLSVSSEFNFTEQNCADGWQFNLENGNTVVSQFGLVCELSWSKPFTVALFMAGMMIGSPAGGQLSDRFGRRTTSLISFALHTVFEYIISFSPYYWLYCCCLFIIGIAGVISYFCVYTWALELMSSSSKRSLAAFCMNTFFGIGSMSVSLIAYLLPDWSWIFRVYAILATIYFPILCFVPESPAWLLQNAKRRKSAQASISPDKDNDDTIKELEAFAVDESNNKIKMENSSPMILWRNRILLRRLLFVCYLWNNTYLGYYTMAYNSSNLGGNTFINNLIGGLLDIGAALLIVGLLKKFSRRRSLIFLVTVFGCLSTTSPPIKQVNETAGIVCALAGRFFATSCMLLAVLYTGELFPTLLRNTSVGIASMSARILSILSPFLIFVGEEIDLSIPFYVMGGVSFVGAYLILRLPESSKSLLPNTVDDALALKEPFKGMICKRKTDLDVELAETKS